MKKNHNSRGMSTNIDPKMLERFQALRLMDDDFMTVVFSGSIEATELLLQILLDRDDLHVKKAMSQKEKRNLFGRSVRLDIIAEDTEKKLYNIEVQRADSGAAARRARYNAAMIDSHTLKKSSDFAELPELYIIFITENDCLNLNEPLYKVKKCFVNKGANGEELPFDDGCNIMYVNGAYRGDDQIGRLMHDFCTANADEMYYEKLAELMRFHKQQEKGVGTMCRIFEEYGNERAAEGRKEGLLLGAQAKAIENARNFLKEGDPVEKIARCCSLPLEQVLALQKELAEA